MDLPRDFASQILASLVRYGFLQSVAGPRGGYRLARPPAEISLLDVLEIIEGPVLVDECLLGGGSCNWTKVCPLHEAWGEATAGFADSLARINSEDLARIEEALKADTYDVPFRTPLHGSNPPRTVRPAIIDSARSRHRPKDST
jgi:Rrf2 family protein